MLNKVTVGAHTVKAQPAVPNKGTVRAPLPAVLKKNTIRDHPAV